jgi:thiosulfate/3-mercaptopyruvate sulfurtransferase
MGPLISSDKLSARLGEKKLRIFDCTTFLHPLPEVGRYRIENGRKAYSDAGHIPGAALIELQEDLSDQTSGLRFTALAPADLVSAFKAKGVGDDSDVVLYAGGDQVWATRVWWCYAQSASIALRCSTAASRSGASRAVLYPR